MSTPSKLSRTAVRHRTSMDAVNPGHPEAIALRRIIIERGHWLSPMLADLPMPTLTDWEASCDLVKALQVWRVHAARAEEMATSVMPIASQAGRGRSYETPTLAEVRERQHPRPNRPVEAKATPAPMPTPEPTPPPASKPAKRPMSADEKAEAIARIAAVKAEIDAKEAAKKAKKATTKTNPEVRKGQVRKARAKWDVGHAERMATDPAYAEAVRAKKREREKRRQARARQKRAEKRAAAGKPPRISKAERAHLMATDPAFVEAQRAKWRSRYKGVHAAGKAIKDATLPDRAAAARKALAAKRPMPTAKELVEEARAAARARGK
jgi:hypothetical protein